MKKSSTKQDSHGTLDAKDVTKVLPNQVVLCGMKDIMLPPERNLQCHK